MNLVKKIELLWSYGLLEVDDYFELVLSWGELSARQN